MMRPGTETIQNLSRVKRLRITKASTNYPMGDDTALQVWVRHNKFKEESMLCVLTTNNENLNVEFSDDIVFFFKGKFSHGCPEVHLTGYIEIYDPKDIL